MKIGNLEESARRPRISQHVGLVRRGRNVFVQLEIIFQLISLVPVVPKGFLLFSFFRLLLPPRLLIRPGHIHNP